MQWLKMNRFLFFDEWTKKREWPQLVSSLTGPRGGFLLLALFVSFWVPEEILVPRQFRAGLGIMSTDSGTLYVIDRYFRYIYALKRTRGCNGQFNWVLECVTIWRGQCPYGPGLHFHGHREPNCS